MEEQVTDSPEFERDDFMRKVLAIVCMLVMVIAFGGCSNGNQTPVSTATIPVLPLLTPNTNDPTMPINTGVLNPGTFGPIQTSTPAPTLTPPAATTGTADGSVILTLYVKLSDTTSKLSVRGSASTSATKSGEVSHNEALQVLEISADWAKIVFNNGVGYVKMDYLTSKAPN